MFMACCKVQNKYAKNEKTELCTPLAKNASLEPCPCERASTFSPYGGEPFVLRLSYMTKSSPPERREESFASVLVTKSISYKMESKTTGQGRTHARTSSLAMRTLPVFLVVIFSALA